MMRLFLFLCTLFVTDLLNARADIVVDLDNPNQSGGEGGTLTFTGTLSNTGSDTVFLNSADLNLAGTSFTLDFVGPFLANVPVSLAAGDKTPDIKLFGVLVNKPFTDPPGTFAGTYSLLGGIDPNAQDLLGSAVFTVSAPATVPEPSPIVFLLVATGFIVMVKTGSDKRSIRVVRKH